MKKKPTHTKQTRSAILDTAILIFAQKSYTTASIRMIATQGGFAHGLVRYYFSNKAELFNAATEKICEDLCQAVEDAVLNVRPMTRASGFSQYVKQLIDFSRKHPWTFRIILLNLSVETAETVPGRTRFLNTVESIRERLIELLEFKASHEEICRFTDSFNALVFYYLGAPESAAWLLRLDPDADEYFKWVHQTLVNIFLPTLEELF